MGKRCCSECKITSSIGKRGRTAWRDVQKSYAEEKKRADLDEGDTDRSTREKEGRRQAEEKRTDEIQMAKIEADKELTLKEI